MHKIEIRVANNGVVVERFEDHTSQEMWVYSGSPVTSSAGLCVQGMLDKIGIPDDDHNLHVARQVESAAAQAVLRSARQRSDSDGEG